MNAAGRNANQPGPVPETVCFGCGCFAIEEFTVGRRQIRLCAHFLGEIVTAVARRVVKVVST